MARFLLPINIRFTGATAAGSEVFAMRAGASELIIRRIVLFAAFDGTAAASSARQELLRFRTAAFTGGTAITPVALDLNDAVTTLADARQDTAGAALTPGLATFDSVMMTGAACPRGATGSVMAVNIDFPEQGIVLEANDGLAIQISVAAVIGDVLAGFIEYEE